VVARTVQLLIRWRRKGSVFPGANPPPRRLAAVTPVSRGSRQHGIMTIDELTDRIAAGNPPELEVHSLAPSMYVVFCLAGDQRSPLTDAAGTRRFTSRYAALQELQAVGVDRIDFVHRSAYDEMVNAPGSGTGNEFREPVDLSSI
jgi:hypothetical protein